MNELELALMRIMKTIFKSPFRLHLAVLGGAPRIEVWRDTINTAKYLGSVEFHRLPESLTIYSLSNIKFLDLADPDFLDKLSGLFDDQDYTNIRDHLPPHYNPAEI